MFTKHTFLLCMLLGLIGVPLVKADEPVDRTKLRDSLMELEKDAWGLMKKKDIAAMREFLADDAVLIFHDAVRLNKTDFLKLLPDYKLDSFAVEGKPEFIMPTSDVATIIYRITYTSAIKEEKLQKVTVLASSNYVCRGGKWFNVHYQETLAK